MTTQSSIVALYGGTTTSPTPIPHWVYTNNMSLHNSYGIMGDGSSPGLASIQMYAPDAIVTGNVLAGGSASKYPAGNFFPSAAVWQAGFVNYSGGDYHLLSSSPYKGAATDGSDLGADIDLVTTKTASAITGDNRVVTAPQSVTTFTDLTSSSTYPLVAGTPVTWTAKASNTLGGVEYRFWLYKKTAWVMVQDYGPSNTYTWTPQTTDAGTPYYLQVWARAVGSTATYEAWRSTVAFDVVPAPLTLTANVFFPTPPGNQVTFTAILASPTSTATEYSFQVVDLSTNTTTVLRSYSSSNQAQWVPLKMGRFVVRGLERQVGSSAAYDLIASTPPLDVAATPITIKALSTPTIFPAPTGTPITWTVLVQGGMAGPIEYAFWLYSTTNGWRNAQPYGPSQTFTWTPTWADEGDFALQVWVRSNGSTAAYDAYTGSNLFHIQHAGLQLTTPTLFPVAVGTPVTWTADVPDPSVTMNYEFWVYTASTSQWSLARGYSTAKTFTWTPLVVGSYGVQVWARQAGSTAPYDSYRSTGLFDVTSGPAQMMSLTSSVALPATAGTTITWTAGAIGGTAQLEYQFWRQDAGKWIMVRDYSTQSTYSWVTTATDVGQHAIQARVRSTGSSSPYESQMTTGVFDIR